MVLEKVSSSKTKPRAQSKPCPHAGEKFNFTADQGLCQGGRPRLGSSVKTHLIGWPH